MLCSVGLTDASCGESCDRYSVSAGDVILGDRIYGLAPSIASVSEGGGYVVVRANLYAIRLCRTNGEVFSPLRESERVPNAGVGNWDILIPAPPKERSKSHKTWKLSQASALLPARLLAARIIRGDIIWILTTLPTSVASDEEVMKLYRLRWQIELLFKRLKSILHMDAMPSRQGPTARSWLLARLQSIRAKTEQVVAFSHRALGPTRDSVGNRCVEVHRLQGEPRALQQLEAQAPPAHASSMADVRRILTPMRGRG